MLMGIRTIRAGQRVAVWNHRGEMKTVDGPKRLWTWRSTIQPLPQHSAREGEYLIVTRRDGRVEHLPGPVAIWHDPVELVSIQVAQAISISAHEVIVVYGREGETVRRRLVRGPAQYVPASGEWLHAFSWHGSDPARPKRKIPNTLRFEKLRVIPDQMYVEVESVRSADDALLAVSFMVFFELADIEKMLDQTHDPIADLLNALTADVIEFAAARSFEAFKSDTEKLNELDSFAQLMGRAASIGYRINKVVYRGYTANPQLQTMHDHAIEARTQLQLEAETEEQAQKLADLKLEREQERAVRKQAMEKSDVEHQGLMERLKTQEELERRRMSSDARRAVREADHQQRMRQRAEFDRLRLAYVGGMREAGVDLTRWMVARYQHPDRLIRIENGHDKVQLQMAES